MARGMPAPQVQPRGMPQVAVAPDVGSRLTNRSLGLGRPRSRTALGGVGIVLALMFVGLFYLSQTFEAAAARYRVDTLLAERQGLLQELRSQQGTALTLGSAATVIQWAQGAGLDRLDRRAVIRTR